MRAFYFVLLILLPGMAQGAIVYTLDSQVTANYSATGTITTDGTLGAIAAANVLFTSITVSEPGNTYSLLSDPVTFTGVNATLTMLSFSGIGQVYFNVGNDFTHWRLRDNDIRTIRTVTSGGQRADITYPHTFATGGTAVPEPSGILPLAAAAALVARRRRRRT